MYPDNWPRCACGDFTIDGKATCGKPGCSVVPGFEDGDDTVDVEMMPTFSQPLPGFLFVSADDEEDAAATSVHGYDSAPPTEREEP